MTPSVTMKNLKAIGVEMTRRQLVREQLEPSVTMKSLKVMGIEMTRRQLVREKLELAIHRGWLMDL